MAKIINKGLGKATSPVLSKVSLIGPVIKSTKSMKSTKKGGQKDK